MSSKILMSGDNHYKSDITCVTNGDAKLPPQEEKAVEEFLSECVPGSTSSSSSSPPSGASVAGCGAQATREQRSLAVKFLRARKWDARRSIELYKSHERLRRAEGFDRIDPNESGVRRELLSEKFTILDASEDSGAVVAIFTACRHRPQETNHRNTLRGLVFQLDAALAHEAAQKNGLLFLYDMTNSKYSNFDYDLSIKILNMLKGNYPARLHKVLILSAPMWFRAPFQVLRLFVRDKLRDRVHTVDGRSLRQHLSQADIPDWLGGERRHSHRDWLAEAFGRLGRSQPPEFFEAPAGPALAVGDCAASSTASTGSPTPGMTDSMVEVSDTDATLVHKTINQSAASTTFDLPSGGLSLAAFAQHVADSQREGLVSEFNRNLGPDRGADKCEAFKRNRDKNRYVDVPCIDASRVRIVDAESDYIHANWVDGYQKSKAYICTQGPTDSTVSQFWRMVWQERVSVIVMTTRLVEGRRVKCARYWPEKVGGRDRYGEFRVSCDGSDEAGDFVESALTLERGGERRQVRHLLFTAWPDFGIPHTAGGFLAFLKRVNELWADSSDPILVHCSAGIGRTGTFITVDVSIKRLLDVGLVDILGLVRRLRKQRAGSIQTADQYVFCHIAVLEFAATENLLPQ